MTAQVNALLTYSVDEVAKLLGLSRGCAYEGIRTGQIPCIKVGRRILVPRRALESLLSGSTSIQEVKS
jgi:excisionase family DNA binding protein